MNDKFKKIFKKLNKNFIPTDGNNDQLIDTTIDQINFERFTSNFINYKQTKKKKNTKTYIILFIRFIINFLKISINLFKNIIIFFLKKNESFHINEKIDHIFFLGQSTNDLLDLKPIINKLSGTKIILTLRHGKYILELKKIFPNIKIYSLKNLLSGNHILLGIILYLKYFFSNLFNKKLNLVLTRKFFYQCLNNFIFIDIAKNKKTSKIFFDNSNDKHLFQSIYKDYNSDCIYYSYILNGISMANDKLVCHYYYKNIDILYCYGLNDITEIKKMFFLNKIRYPRKIIPINSARNLNHKHSKNFIKNEKIKILYIKSNPSLLNKLDIKSLKILTEVLKKIDTNLYSLTVKERPQQPEINSKHELIKKKFLKLDQIIFNNKKKTEDLILDSDIVIGTFSTSLMQVIYFKKLTIQIGSKEIFWNNFQHHNLLFCNNKKELFKILNNILIRSFYKKKLNKQNKHIKKLFNTKINSVNKILSIFRSN